ncbi:twin arginine-targeting protein translocase TatC [Sphingorhabdus lutea]|uniref:Sec-independent protein translocase protein TatC n=1 Tax=Sphingorhabdus lutea TaxID=1913578 RepID=A0A1L3JFC0_9SPHN|nr:twin arginine-targeting protein translocase TatC [Sphingorhabdus lutea]
MEDKETGGQEGEMTLMEHLIELRTRLLYCFLALAISFGVCFYFAKSIFAFLVQPLLVAGQGKIIYTNIFEAFFTEIKVAFFAALMVAFPVLATQIWRFIAPGLFSNEKKAFLPFLLMTPILFGLGAAMAYYVAMPVALKFLLGFSGDVGGVTQEALPGVGNYLDFVTTFIFGFGISFLLPLLLILLEKAGIVSLQQLKSGRRYAIVGAFVVAAVLTPPDIVSQFLLGVPLVILYELAIIVIGFSSRHEKKPLSVNIPK